MHVIASRVSICHKLEYPREVLESLAAGGEGGAGRGAGQWKSLIAQSARLGVWGEPGLEGSDHVSGQRTGALVGVCMFIGCLSLELP